MRLQQARALDLFPRPPQYPAVTSLLLEYSSGSLALMLSDSSVLLFPSVSPFCSSPSSPAPSSTAVPPVSTAACFARLLPSPTARPARVLFFSASPLAAGAAVALRAWVFLRAAAGATRFAPARLGFRRDPPRHALALGIPHGASVRLAGSVNVLAIHSLAAAQIWVLAARLSATSEDEVDLVKCAVVDLVRPVYSVAVSMGFLLLGEVEGVRAFPLRPLIKGRAVMCRGSGSKALGAARSIDLRRQSVPNGVVLPASRAKSGPSLDASGEPSGAEASGMETGVGETAAGSRASGKLRTVRLRQDSADHSFFWLLRCAGLHNMETGTGIVASLKAISIHALSQKKFLVLDSAGDLHLMSLHNTAMASEAIALSITSEDTHINYLNNTLKVQMLAVLPDISTKNRVVWMSDGGYSIYMMTLADTESPVPGNDEDGSKQKAIEISATEVIFMSEAVQDLVPLSANAALILGQGNVFAYAAA